LCQKQQEQSRSQQQQLTRSASSSDADDHSSLESRVLEEQMARLSMTTVNQLNFVQGEELEEDMYEFEKDDIAFGDDDDDDLDEDISAGDDDLDDVEDNINSNNNNNTDDDAPGVSL
jgi:hypothetical protein